MRNALRLAMATLTAAAGALGATATVAEGATTGGPFAAMASGGVFSLTVAGQRVMTAGTASVAASADHGAQAQGSGFSSPLLAAAATATAPTPGTAQQPPQVCAPAPAATAIPSPFNQAISFQSGCGTASAADATSGLPTATATATVEQVTVGAGTSLLPDQVAPGSTLASALQSALGTLPSLPAGGLPITTLLSDLGAATSGSGVQLASVTLGTSSAAVATTTTAQTAVAQVSGGQIDVLPGVGAHGAPLLTLKVGSATASTTLDRTSGAVTATDSPVALSITVDPPVGSPQTQSLTQGQSQTLLAGTPLQTTVAVDSGTADPGSGQGSATATGLTVDLLQGVGASSATGEDGGIDLSLSTANAAEAGAPTPVVPAALTSTPTTAPPATPAAPVPGVTTVHTGEPWAGPLPLALAGLALVAGLVLVARRRLGALLGQLGPGHPRPGVHHPLSGPAPGTQSVPPPDRGPARQNLR